VSAKAALPLPVSILNRERNMEKRRIPWQMIFVVIQCTWGILQTFLGLILFLRYIRQPHQWYRCVAHTAWDIDGGISLGLFIFTPDKDEKRSGGMMAHEYGHTRQSLMLGPLYLAVIGVPSILWERLKWCRRLRREKGIPYSWFYTERWADRLGSIYISE